MRKSNQAVLASLLAAVAVPVISQSASAQLLRLGSWENLVTPPPADPDPLPSNFRRPIGASGTENWVDFSNRGIYDSDTYGATHGTRSVKMRTADDGNGRYNQSLSIPLHVAGAVDEFLISGQFAIDVSWKHSDWVGGNWSGIDGLVINSVSPGFQNVGRATTDSARPDPADTFHGFWDAVNWTDNTRTLTWDMTAYVDGNTANGEIQVVQSNSGGGYFNLVLITNYDSAFDPSTAAFYFDNARFLPRVVSSEWKGGAIDPDNDAGNGNAATNLWFASQNWTAGVAGTADSSALFGSNAGAITGAQNINLDQSASLGTLSFDLADGYTIAGTGSLTLDITTGPAAMNVASGSHTVSVPLTLADDVTISASTGASVAFTGAITANNHVVTKTGGGTAVVSNLRDASLNVSGGTFRVAANGTNAGTSKVTALSVSGAGSTLDITNNSFIVDYTGSSPLSAVVSQLASGYAGGAWTGAGINSSSAAANAGASVGYAEASDLGLTSFGGQTVDGSAIVIRYTRAGDANLDGTTNISDFSLLAANFNQPGAWNKGNFNYDAVVNINDFAILAANFNQSAAGGLPRAAVPEPALGAIAAAGLVAMRRRRA